MIGERREPRVPYTVTPRAFRPNVLHRPTADREVPLRVAQIGEREALGALLRRLPSSALPGCGQQDVEVLSLEDAPAPMFERASKVEPTGRNLRPRGAHRHDVAHELGGAFLGVEVDGSM